MMEIQKCTNGLFERNQSIDNEYGSSVSQWLRYDRKRKAMWNEMRKEIRSVLVPLARKTETAIRTSVHIITCIANGTISVTQSSNQIRGIARHSHTLKSIIFYRFLSSSPLPLLRRKLEVKAGYASDCWETQRFLNELENPKGNFSDSIGNHSWRSRAEIDFQRADTCA